MRQHSNLAKDTAEKVVKDIRQATRSMLAIAKALGVGTSTVQSVKERSFIL